MKLGFFLPVRTQSEANLREHWAKKAKRTKGQREAAYLVTLQLCRLHRASWGRANITLTRIAPRKLDSDNLARAMKAVRDGIADALGIDDGDERLKWNYAQGKGLPKQYGVKVELEGTGIAR